MEQETLDPNRAILSWRAESPTLGTLGAHVTLTGELSTYIVEKTLELLALQMKRSILRAMKENDIITPNDRPTNDA